MSYSVIVELENVKLDLFFKEMCRFGRYIK